MSNHENYTELTPYDGVQAVVDKYPTDLEVLSLDQLRVYRDDVDREKKELIELAYEQSLIWDAKNGKVSIDDPHAASSAREFEDPIVAMELRDAIRKWTDAVEKDRRLIPVLQMYKTAVRRREDAAENAELAARAKNVA